MPSKDSFSSEETLSIFGARENNLKNIDLSIPRNKLVVFTGISGSGKSSLAFDTIYAEGQRRYMESFSAYARSFIGDMQRPDVDKITGLSPVISIEQKTTSKNPRSTVGTTTEIYDFLRLLFARAADAYSYVTGEPMIRQSEEQIVEAIAKNYKGQKISILSPLVRARKGHYRELFAEIRKKGFSKARVDGKIIDIDLKTELDRYKTHDIELLVDKIEIQADLSRLKQSIRTALTMGKGVVLVMDAEQKLRFFSRNLMCPTSGIGYDEPAPNLFSFNSPYGACPTCNGLGQIDQINYDAIFPDPSLSVSRGGIAPLGEYRDVWIFKKIDAILKMHGFNVSTPIGKISKEVLDILIFGTKQNVDVPSVKYQATYWNTQYDGIMSYLNSENQTSESENERKKPSQSIYLLKKNCPDCQGARLKTESLHFKIADQNIAQLCAMDLGQLGKWFDGLEARLSPRQQAIAGEVLKEIRKRLGFMLNVGLDYLTLDRPMRTLSGGEAQRIRLATQIGSQLVGVLYILDEPSIGLHQRDNVKLIEALKNLRDLGNTVLVVEHDKEMMLESDFIVDVGPGAGIHGGRVVAAASPKDFLKSGTATASYLANQERIAIPQSRRKGNGKYFSLLGASGHNLKNVDLNIPLGTFTCITGVSGSGKSSLIHQTLFPVLNAHFFNSKMPALPYQSVQGLEFIDKVIEVDQSPIGRTPRSNPATYTGMFTDIRTLFSELTESKIRGYKPGRFSFNVKGGRCETCEGGGKRLIEMEFLPDVYVQCETCKGKRYNRETLEVRFKGKSISDVLDMTVEASVDFFSFQPSILRRVKALNEVGLGYITLGQHATTLSGGEAQRVKLATELSRKATGNTLFILDEPSTGLHFQDIRLLLEVLHRLVELGNTVLVIEHNLDIVKTADWVIDMGPEGGSRGGQIVCQGTPEQVAKDKKGHTGKFLKAELTGK
jgi:excinuclease ABC subunit A